MSKHKRPMNWQLEVGMLTLHVWKYEPCNHGNLTLASPNVRSSCLATLLHSYTDHH